MRFVLYGLIGAAVSLLLGAMGIGPEDWRWWVIFLGICLPINILVTAFFIGVERKL